jgi:hypothetical protein
MLSLRVIIGACATAATVAHAQAPAATASSSNGQRLEYQSVFRGYRSFTVDETVSWRRANEALGAAAGHAARPAQPAAAAEPRGPSPASPAKAAPAAVEHAGQKH